MMEKYRVKYCQSTSVRYYVGRFKDGENIMIKKLLIGGAVAAMTLSACAQKPETTDSGFNPDTQRIKSHLFFLADDLLEGRDTGSKGHEMAALYIATEFAKYGLKPAGTDGYVQRVNFRKANLIQESPAFTLTRGGETINFEYPKQYLAGPSLLSTDAKVEGELVFVGYGIVADELDHNDYENMDVDGKIVVTLAGKPGDFPSEEGAHFASGYQKQKYAAERGAIGMITITTPKNEKVRPYQSRLSYIHTPRMAWLNEDGEPANTFAQIKGGAYLSEGAAKTLFDGAEHSLEEVYAELEADKVPKGFELPGTVSLSKQSTHEVVSSPNVVGMLEGSDPTLKNEYVVFSAHSDHIGFAKTVKKDNINNGAMDNASGTSVMLETARLFSEMKEKPKRSILFVSVTGEEKGLLGSQYYVMNPTLNLNDINYVLNMDMVGRLNAEKTLAVYGLGTSPILKQIVNANAGDLKIAENESGVGPSDHTSFYLADIPVLPFFTGQHEDYHKPSDDTEKVNFEGMEIISNFIFSIINNVRFTRSKRLITKKQRPN